jgi:hypothetical protein
VNKIILDTEKMKSSFELHRSQPEISFENHVRNKKIELGRSLDSLQAIYLDTRFWIFIRDAFLDNPQHTIHIQLLSTLRSLVSDKKIFCPISDITLIEILKQTDATSRKTLALLVDELSLGVSFCPEQERVGTELAYFLYSCALDRTDLYPLKWLVWNKITSALGTAQVTASYLDDNENLVTQKVFFDHLWEVGYLEMLETMGIEKALPKMPYDELAVKLTELNNQYSNELKSYKGTYLREFQGALELNIDIAKDIANELRQKLDMGQRDAATNESFIKCLLANLIEAARKERVSKALPTLHIIAHCHASIRWDKKRKFSGNDMPDFHHASVALPYCTAFLTEKPLKDLLTSGNAKLHEDYLCKVISDSEEANDFLIQLNIPK